MTDVNHKDDQVDDAIAEKKRKQQELGNWW
jgi:hypothetical protein